MSFYHVNQCDCPSGCCDCSDSTSSSVYIEESDTVIDLKRHLESLELVVNETRRLIFDEENKNLNRVERHYSYFVTLFSDNTLNHIVSTTEIEEQYDACLTELEYRKRRGK